MTGQYGESPNVVRGGQEDYKRLFYSRPEQALMRDVSLRAGYGILKAGTPLSIDAGGKYFPYAPTVPDSSDVAQKANAFIVADGTSAAIFYCTMKDSYKFAVGDTLIAYDTNTSTTSAIDLGLVVSIDRTTYQHMALVTVTSNITTGITVALSGAVHIKSYGADNTNGYSDCKGILAATVDTGEGENAKGGLAPMILGMAILYEGCCEGLDAAAKVDISASSNGNLLVIK